MDLFHRRIDDDPPCTRMSFCLTPDLTGNGRPDIVIGALGSKWPLDLPLLPTIDLGKIGPARAALQRLETNVFWYENPTWERHDVARAPELSVGGAFGDITGDGRLSLVAGQNINRNKLWWFELPANPRKPWQRRLITDDFEKYHDVAVADVDDDGSPEVLGLSQESDVIFYYDIPTDPRREPWPVANRHIVAEDLSVEGVAVGDIDGDGRTEIVAGANVFHRTETGNWEREPIADGWEYTRVAVADLDGDGTDEILLVEGDIPFGSEDPSRRARLGMFDPPEWKVTVLREDLSNPHTLQVADFDRDGTPDIFVAEMGLESGHDPRQLLFRNDGSGNFEVETLGTGVPTHEAKVTDLTGNGSVDIVGKAYTQQHVDIWSTQPVPGEQPASLAKRVGTAVSSIAGKTVNPAVLSLLGLLNRSRFGDTGLNQLAGTVLPDRLHLSVDDETYRFHLSTYHEYDQFKRYESEPDKTVLRRFIADLETDDTVWDIGANVGLFTVIAASRCPDGQVTAIEPYPSNVARIRENLKLNGFDATIEQLALAEESGTATFGLSSPDGTGAFGVLDSEEESQMVPVRTVTGDDLVAGTTPAPTVLKIDVQGSELGVLRGLDESLPNCRLIYCNVYEKHFSTDEQERELQALLTEAGFEYDRIGEWEHGYFLRATREPTV